MQAQTAGKGKWDSDDTATWPTVLATDFVHLFWYHLAQALICILDNRPSETTFNEGKPLESYEAVVNLIGSTTTETGLRVKCDLDPNEYIKSIKVDDEEFSRLNIVLDEWHGEWNYCISPREHC